MDYHQERFKDHSLMIYQNDELIAVFPANELSGEIHSHQGLSYGGLLLLESTLLVEVMEVFKSVLRYYSEDSFYTLHIKLLPHMYHNLPSDEMNYLMFKVGAKNTRRDLASAIDLKHRIPLDSSNRIRGLKKAIKKGVIVKEEDSFESFWSEILIPNLKATHGVSPVHSLEEITFLKKRFPENIRQFNAYVNEKIVAGTTVFETKNVAHAQYISADFDRQSHGGLDLIFDTLINKVFKDKSYFDFGISNENNGQNIKLGLLKWKESFGASSIVHDFYSIETKAYNKLEDVWI